MSEEDIPFKEYYSQRWWENVHWTMSFSVGTFRDTEDIEKSRAEGLDIVYSPINLEFSVGNKMTSFRFSIG